MMRIFLTALLTCFSLSAFAQKIMAVTEEYPPYNYAKDGKVTGFSTEIVEATLIKAGLQHDIQSYPWVRAYNMALKDKNTLIFSIRRTEEREKLFKWVDVIHHANIYLYKAKARKDINIKTIEDAKQYITVVIPEDASTQKLLDAGFEIKKNLHMSPVPETNILLVHKDRAQFVPEDEIGLAYLAHQGKLDPKLFEKTIMIPGLPGELYMAFSNSTPDEIVKKCQKAFKEIKKDGTYDRIKKKYLK